MLDHVYASFWVADAAPPNLLLQFLRFLLALPHSSSRPGFGELVLRAVDSTEAPLREKDLLEYELGPLEIIEILRNDFQNDTACELESWWDFNSYNPAAGKWEMRAQRLEIICRGAQFDEGLAATAGHLQVDLGFAHLLTGDPDEEEPDGAPDDSAIEASRQNIKRVYAWIEDVTARLEIARYSIWSEGEENVEARLDEILARR